VEFITLSFIFSFCILGWHWHYRLGNVTLALIVFGLDLGQWPRSVDLGLVCPGLVNITDVYRQLSVAVKLTDDNNDIGDEEEEKEEEDDARENDKEMKDDDDDDDEHDDDAGEHGKEVKDEDSDTDTDDTDADAEVDAAVRDKVRSALGNAAVHSDVEVLSHQLAVN